MKLSDKSVVTSFTEAQSYLHLLDQSEAAASDQDKRIRVNGALLDELASTRELVNINSVAGSITLDCANRLERTIRTTLTENISPGGITISNLRSSIGCRIYWHITASGADRQIPVTALPTGTTIDGSWTATIPQDETRVVVFETFDNGVTFRLTSNAPMAEFAGSGTNGVVPDPGSELGHVLMDDGTWSSKAPLIVDATASRTLTSSDEGKIIYMTNTGSVTVTIPNSLDVGFHCNIVSIGTTTVTFSATDTRHPATGTLSGDGKAAFIQRYNTGNVAIIGNLS